MILNLTYSLDKHPNGYSVSSSEAILSPLVSPYAARHLALSKTNGAVRWGHRAIALLQSIPIVGLLASLIERIVVFIHKFFHLKAKNQFTPAPKIVPQPKIQKPKSKPTIPQPFKLFSHLPGDALQTVSKFLDFKDCATLALCTEKIRHENIWKGQAARLNLKVPAKDVGKFLKEKVIIAAKDLIDFFEHVKSVGCNEKVKEIKKQSNLNELQKADALRKWLQSSQKEVHINKNISYVTDLDLIRKNIKTIPPEIRFFAELDTLCLYRNEIKQFPVEISKLKIRSLQLSDNGLEELPHEIGNMKHLNDLDVRSNLFSQFPSQILNLSNLESLNLHRTKLIEFPNELSKLKKLKYLNLAQNGIKQLPLPICELTELEIINLYENLLEDLPDELRNLQKLKSLHLAENKFKRFPISITNLLQLNRLNLSENQIPRLSSQIGNLLNLTELNLNNNQLSALPEELENLKNLQTLYIANNRFDRIPAVVCRLSELIKLSLASNPIDQLPHQIANLRKLSILHIQNTSNYSLENLSLEVIVNLSPNTLIYVHEGQLPEGLMNIHPGIRIVDF